ncbi:MAG: PEP-CTERM sorting domain-containing protein [Armatimonadota bacterium]
MSKSTLYCIACVVMLIGTVCPVLAFTVSISNYGCVYSGWEESWWPDENGVWTRHYWSGTATERLRQDSHSWGTNRPNTMTCQFNGSYPNLGATITNSGSVPSASYLWLKGYGPHVVGSFINYYQFDFDLTCTGMSWFEPWYVCVVNMPSSFYYYDFDIRQCTSYATKQLWLPGKYHVTGNLNGSGVPVIVLSNVPPGVTVVPEPSSVLALLSGIVSLVGACRFRRRP